MTIKEIEEASGMQRANIRFYEEEGFLHPEREKKSGQTEKKKKCGISGFSVDAGMPCRSKSSSGGVFRQVGAEWYWTNKKLKNMNYWEDVCRIG